MQIPWAEPVLDEQEVEAVVQTLRSGWVGMGPRVKQFESEMAAYVGVPHSIAASTGTAALDMALKALGVGRDDEVIMPAMAYIAGAFATSYQAARLVLADVDGRTFNMDPLDVERRISPRTKALIVIDYGGQVADYDALMEIADRRGIAVIEDAAGALGGSWRGKKAGSFGHIAITSFHAAKILTTVEGGMVFTHDPELAARCRIVRNQGEDPGQKYRHVMVGNNYRMTDIAAAIGLVQFARLPELLSKRAYLCQRYNQGFSDLQDVIQLPYLAPERVHGWFFYPILVNDRDEVARRLKERGVDYRVAWPIPLHQQPAYCDGFPVGTTYPVAEAVAARMLDLPLYHGLTDEQQDHVIASLRSAVGAGARSAARVA